MGRRVTPPRLGIPQALLDRLVVRIAEAHSTLAELDALIETAPWRAATPAPRRARRCGVPLQRPPAPAQQGRRHDGVTRRPRLAGRCRLCGPPGVVDAAANPPP